ncbi:unnamed protein product [Thelazia callipaeda]|uniref:PlsC domain-containing protein n=1 Tax=Thelazia callipaeda TaxID=103827 RepID=A0A0N5CN01_THECL|nr:unnamed protein product [Thelazia callipaeda]
MATISSIPAPEMRPHSPYKPPGDKSAWATKTNLERIIWILQTPFRTLLCLSNVTIFLLAYFGFMFPVLWARSLWPRLYWFYEGKLYSCLQAFVGYSGYTAGYDVYEYGDDVEKFCVNERIILMCNHQSTADVPVLMTILQSKGVASRKTLWLMDVMFRWTPFGIIGQMHGDYFIRQGKATREKELIRLKDHLRKVFWDRDRHWVILFPEGGFYYKRIKSSQKYGKEHGYPHLEHATLPRFGAVKAIMEEVGPKKGYENIDTAISKNGSKLKLIKDTVGAIREKKYIKEMRPPVKYVLDVTIAYPHKLPLSLFTLSFGTREPCDIGVHYKIYDARDVPFDDEEKLRDWMYSVYQYKDNILDRYYKEGVFVRGEEGVRVYFLWWKIVGQYIFWITSFYVQYRMFSFLILHFLQSIGLLS